VLCCAAAAALRYELQIDFLDAVFGCKKELEIMHLTGARLNDSNPAATAL
jgi:DnaJ-class molecular chaperone